MGSWRELSVVVGGLLLQFLCSRTHGVQRSDDWSGNVRLFLWDFVGIHDGNQYGSGQALKVFRLLRRRYLESEPETDPQLRSAMGALLPNAESRRQQRALRYQCVQNGRQDQPVYKRT